ncbi:hypothetical protein PG996_010125 [Apiospora saccharicola]|uniref:Regulatory P domain-containing protein n=1 Tax=Apiospora saccharicola TaxID=335842 RepID=A0ABR1UMN3_9PEZI
MKSQSFLVAVVAAWQSTAMGKEIPNPVRSERYDSGEVHEGIMALKHAHWATREQMGVFEVSQYKSYTEEGPVPCVDGYAEVIPGDTNNTFACSNVDFYDFKSHADLGSAMGQGSSSWGWTSPEGREFVAVAQADGAAFAELTKAGKLVYLGRLPQYTTAKPSLWRELRGYKNYIVIGSEAVDHGVQVFDMSKLVDIDPDSPVNFTNEKDLTGYWNGLPVGRTHNIVINEEKEYAVAVGAQPRTSACGSGLTFIDLSDPTNPVSPGCAPGDSYVHDAQCLVYRGPDAKYNEKDICYGYNEDTLTIYDVTDKNTTNIISRTGYEGSAFTHQGWVLDKEWQEYLVLDDEYDEYDKTDGGVGKPITYFWDIKSLEAPKLTGFYRHSRKGIDHNQFVVDGFAYQSNYGQGLSILDLTSIPSDPTGGSVTEAGFFDIYPEDDQAEGGGMIDFVGTWSHYPFFKSGHILINTMERGAYVVKRTT